MSRHNFFPEPVPVGIADLVALTGGIVQERGDFDDGSRTFCGVAPLDRANSSEISFLDNIKYLDDLRTTHSGVCFVSSQFVEHVPSGTIAILTPQPYLSFALASARLFPLALAPGTIHRGKGVMAGATISPDARLESDVTIDPGVVIGPFAHIGSGSTIAANSVIGPGVQIGRGCHIGSNVTIMHSFLGNGVIIHSGASIGQDGFGFSIGRNGHTKVPQTGRVVIQDNVEIGANSAIDRGANRDTVIGEGTKIDNLVQIAHNVVIGRHCLIAGQVGIAGSSILGDFVFMGGQVGVAGHVKIGSGVQIAGGSDVHGDIAPGSKVGGSPARPLKQWFREVAVLSRIADKSRGGGAVSD